MPSAGEKFLGTAIGGIEKMLSWRRNVDRANVDALRDMSEPAAGQAVMQTPSVDLQAPQLSAAAQTIEGFVSLIGDITGQIDLLNATIESACACEGEFAVIAGEVRTLAAQVRQAADAIAIAASNGISGEVSAALEGIKGAIHRINVLMAEATVAASLGRHSLGSPQRSTYRN
jgi:methyl-accepting chemotaxis protein